MHEAISIFSVHQEHTQCIFHGTQGTTAWELFSPIPSLFCKEFLLQRGQEACKHWDLPALSVILWAAIGSQETVAYKFLRTLADRRPEHMH